MNCLNDVYSCEQFLQLTVGLCLPTSLPNAVNKQLQFVTTVIIVIIIIIIIIIRGHNNKTKPKCMKCRDE